MCAKYSEFRLEEAIERSQKKPNRTVVKSRPKAEPEEKDDERFAD